MEKASAKDPVVRDKNKAAEEVRESLFADLKKAAQRGREDRGGPPVSK